MKYLTEAMDDNTYEVISITDIEPLNTVDEVDEHGVIYLSNHTEHNFNTPLFSQSLVKCDWDLDAYSDGCRLAAKNSLIKTAKVLSLFDSSVKVKNYICEHIVFGDALDAQKLCDQPPVTVENCIFYSFGIHFKHNFENDLVTKWGCQGIGLDPSFNKDSELKEGLLFMKFGANLLKNEEVSNKNWLMTSIPSLKRWLNHEKLAVLKLDCNGCEFALARDVSLEDPFFFENLNQLSVKMHVSKKWIKNEEYLHNMGLLLYLIEKAGLILTRVEVSSCKQEDEILGCPKFLSEIGYKCGPEYSCHHYLFGRRNQIL
ncbi:hypothetical protein HK099_001677 [Clydaea vesicula]|uniref:Methyltransferase domain-containing protein n=1 Tax=Clydaea vesicula TaxID=447962 RepID=A0AAD5U7N0_9FUNG|nr:hypothetical protein HK099_001677 [Clydaea vesicula]KAJ3394639.1 hypothetical protein HDU92_006744 [Lobulomyces angularis]